MTTKQISIIPCGHYVLVEPDKIEKVTAGGIILNDDMVSKENTAKVYGTLVAVGQNAWKAFSQGEPDGVGKPWAKIGDRVYLKRHVSDKVLDEKNLTDGEPTEYWLLNDENILAVIEE